MSVVPFQRPEKPEPHMSGQAVCIGCRHEWVQAAPIGTWQYECPNCGAMKGLFKHPVGAIEGDLAFVCNCGCEALTAYQRYGKFWLRCMACGVDHTESIFG